MAICLDVQHLYFLIYLYSSFFFRLQSQQTDKQDLSDIHKPEKLRYEDLEEHISTLEGKF